MAALYLGSTAAVAVLLALLAVFYSAQQAPIGIGVIFVVAITVCSWIVFRNRRPYGPLPIGENDGMSDERKKRSHWLIAILPALAVLVTYLGAYYGTTQEVRLQDGTNRVVGVYYVHNVGGRRLPWWANVSFGPRTGSINTSTDASGDKLPCQSAKPGFNRRH